jgi:cyclophilin family peptidyl-prolyl cis-trans isomerase
LHVANFDSLVSESFYDSTAFHRVIPGFMIQGGDPNSKHGPRETWGMGDSTQPTVNAEFSVAKHLRGTLSAARDTDINSANSQFFICVAPASWLNGNYSVYGRVTSGMNIVDTIVSQPRDSVDNPFQKIEMFISYIGSNDSVPSAPPLIQPLNGASGIGANTVVKWAALPDGIIYHLDVSTDSLFSTFFKSVDLAVLTNTLTGLSAATTYYWRVRTNNGGHFSAWSPTWRFHTTGVGMEEHNDPQISIYPNPSNGEILFESGQNMRQIVITDMLGRQVYKSAISGTSYRLDLSHLPKGLYSCQFSDAEGHLTRKTIMLQ